MARLNKHRLRSTRPKAFPGETLVGAGITAAASIAGAAMQAAAAKNAAKQQAEATRTAALMNAEALQKQNDINTENQEQQIAFTRTQNERNRDLQKQIQMNLQMLTGQQNENERLEAAKIQVKNGGSARRRLRNAYEDGGISTMNSSYGGANIPFRVTDGGGVIPIATTPEGYDLYEIVGNDHEHYHKARGGKNKTGVGIKFYGQKDGTIEGEGNQNSNQGELMLVTPNDAKFISKHTIKGFNPAQAVLSGMHPLAAFNQQEAIKDIYGISDSGMNTSTTPVREMKRRIRPFGGNNYPNIIPDLSLDYLAPVATGVGYIVKNRNEDGSRSLKRCGGRKKMYPGGSPYYWMYNTRDRFNYINDKYDNYNSTVPTTNNTQQIPNYKNLNTGGYSSFDETSRGNLAGAGITAAGNIIGGVLTNWGNNVANRFNIAGIRDAAAAMRDAYSNLKTVDMNLLNRNDFRAAHAMAAIVNPYVNINPELALTERANQRRLSAINRNTLSGAASLNRTSRAETDAYDLRSRIFGNRDKIKQSIIQGNAERLTNIANENANRDVQANNDFTRSYLELLAYNNDILNEKIRGIGQTTADEITGIAGANASTHQANTNTWSNVVSGIGGTFGNTLATNAKMRNEYDMTMLGATDDAVLRSIYANPNTRQSRNAAYGIWMRYKNSSDANYKRIADELARDYNFS